MRVFAAPALPATRSVTCHVINEIRRIVIKLEYILEADDVSITVTIERGSGTNAMNFVAYDGSFCVGGQGRGKVHKKGLFGGFLEEVKGSPAFAGDFERKVKEA